MNNKVKTAIALTALTCAATAGTALAYLTDYEEVINRFNLNTDFAIELTEPAFDTSQAATIVPAQSVAKDPQISNTGQIDAYIAAKVEVPLFDGSLVNAIGNTESVKDHDLFSYSINESWTQSNEETLSNGNKAYTYVYNDAIAPGEATESIFDEVTLANLTKGAGINEAHIKVSAFAIQADGFDDPLSAYEAYIAQSTMNTTA